MLGDRSENIGLELNDRKLVTEGVAMSWYIFWTIISVITFGMEFEILFVIAIVAVIIGLAAGIGYFFINEDFFRFRRKTQVYDEKTKELFMSTKRKILNYLKTNAGNAYTKKALLTRLEESVQHPYFKKYIIKNGEKILNNLVSDGIIQTTQKNQETHYFSLNEI